MKRMGHPGVILLCAILAPPLCARREERIDSRAMELASARMTHSILLATNAVRAEHGLRPLRLNAKLTRAAEDRLRDMYDQRYFDHYAPDGTEPFVWFTREQYDYLDAGENLAKAYNSGQSVVDDWMQSPAHRSNVLGEKYEDIGIAIAAGTPFGEAKGATIVALYGREKNAPPPAGRGAEMSGRSVVHTTEQP
jgi:hypothetical protein